MNDKPMKPNGIQLAQAATGISPADFPLGSLQSRASARALLDQADRMKPRLSQYDDDALTIYQWASFFLSKSTSPSLSEVEATEIFRCGRDVNFRRPDSSPRRDPDASAGPWKPFDGITRLEEIINDCRESAGEEKLSYPPDCTPALREQIIRYLTFEMLRGLLELAWERQLSELPFPIRIRTDDNKIRVLIRRPAGAWQEADESEFESILGLTYAELKGAA